MSRLAALLAVWFGCGLSPRAPGTIGSLGALPLHFLLCLLPVPLHVLGALAVVGVGIWAAQRYASKRSETDRHDTDSHDTDPHDTDPHDTDPHDTDPHDTDPHDTDPQSVVIDEVAGTVLALGLVRGEPWMYALAAFLLFRLFDIWKPGLIRRAERARPVGLGIMLDDVLAGLLAGLLAKGLASSLANAMPALSL